VDDGRREDDDRKPFLGGKSRLLLLNPQRRVLIERADGLAGVD
jgi:hypothetical protein